MKYAKIENGVVVKYPLTKSQIEVNLDPNVNYVTVMPRNVVIPSVFYNVVEHYPILINGVWVENHVRVPKDLEPIKKAMRNKVASLRYAKETGGLVLSNGNWVSTDRNLVVEMHSVQSSLSNGFIETVNWKSYEKPLESKFSILKKEPKVIWLELDLVGFNALLKEIVVFVNDCFNEEKLVLDLIDSADFETLQTLNLKEYFK